jgi:beta-glucosidase
LFDPSLIGLACCSKLLSDSPSDVGFGITSASYGKTFYQENIFVGYRHFDKSKMETLFPFGHGLSYTAFSFSDLNASEVSFDGEFEITFKIKNTGKIAGKEVAQVYVRDVESSLARPIKELKAFKKVALEAGEEQSVTIKLDKDALKFWDDSREYWNAEAGEFEIQVGPSSVELPLKTVVKLEKSLTWLGL